MIFTRLNAALLTRYNKFAPCEGAESEKLKAESKKPVPNILLFRLLALTF
jgi:hypothetical protein